MLKSTFSLKKRFPQLFAACEQQTHIKNPNIYQLNWDQLLKPPILSGKNEAPYVCPIPPEWVTEIERMYFKIDPYYMSQIEFYSQQAAIFWGKKLNLDTGIREFCATTSTTPMVKIAFTLLFDCWYDIDNNCFTGHHMRRTWETIFCYIFWHTSYDVLCETDIRTSFHQVLNNNKQMILTLDVESVADKTAFVGNYKHRTSVIDKLQTLQKYYEKNVEALRKQKLYVL